jgi:hypothetical protein
MFLLQKLKDSLTFVVVQGEIQGSQRNQQQQHVGDADGNSAQYPIELPMKGCRPHERSLSAAGNHPVLCY